MFRTFRTNSNPQGPFSPSTNSSTRLDSTRRPSKRPSKRHRWARYVPRHQPPLTVKQPTKNGWSNSLGICIYNVWYMYENLTKIWESTLKEQLVYTLMDTNTSYDLKSVAFPTKLAGDSWVLETHSNCWCFRNLFNQWRGIISHYF